MKKITLDNIIATTIGKLPVELVPAECKEDTDSPYYFYGCIMSSIIKRVVNDGDYAALDSIIDFSNELTSSKEVDDDVKNLIGIEVFEIIVGDKEVAEYTKPRLNPESLHAFELAMKYCGYKD